jgi:hypothetical protein
MNRLRQVLFATIAAGCVLPCSASAFNRSKVPGTDIDLFWCARNIPFITNELGSKHAGAATFGQVAFSFSSWSKIEGADLDFTDQGTTARTDIGWDPLRADNIDLVVWREVDCASVVPAADACLDSGDCNNKYNCWDHADQVLALTTTTFNNKTGEIFDADIELDGANFVFTTAGGLPPCSNPPPADTTGCVAFDVRNALTHQVGHLLGLADVCPSVGAPCVAPCPVMANTESIGDLSKRALNVDDENGLTTIYPMGGATVGCQALTVNPIGAHGCGCSTSSGAFSSMAGALLGLLLVSRRTLRRSQNRPQRQGRTSPTSRCPHRVAGPGRAEPSVMSMRTISRVTGVRMPRCSSASRHHFPACTTRRPRREGCNPATPNWRKRG